MCNGLKLQLDYLLVDGAEERNETQHNKSLQYKHIHNTHTHT